jgi:xylan 1,4-beta-xylosidase
MKNKLLLSFAILFNHVVHAQQLVMPGDHPDPSVVKIGDTYWASATSSNWFPAYPLMKSKDLVKWNTVGYVFNQLPQWADFYFWAPEINYDNGKVYVYYAAHKKNGNLCVGVASADKPEGPYRDHGPLVCQEAGSIDAFPMRDENGKLYLIWKEDGNSVGKQTPIWAQQMNEERTALTGEKKELFRNDVPWEGNLVEGVSIMRHGQYYYAFYAAAGCCGRACTYGTGIARAKNLLGPWQKYEKNPVLTNDDIWQCPGHGTPVEKNGRYYLLYHAYKKGPDVYAGRQGLLIEFEFTADDWIQFHNNEDKNISQPKFVVKDEFNSKTLLPHWQWSVFQPVKYQLKNGCLELQAGSSSQPVYLGQKQPASSFDAEVVINTEKSTAGAGIGLIGDDANQLNAIFEKDSLRLMILKEGKETVTESRPFKGKTLHIRMSVGQPGVLFLYGANGKSWNTLNLQAIDPTFLPPWDRGLRAGIVARGNAGAKAVFERFIIQ